MRGRYGFILICVFSAQVAWAQTLSLTGRVVDPQGAAIAGAEVTVTSSVGRQPLTTRTDTQGRFAFTPGAPGEYVVRVTSAGFATRQERVTITGTSGASVVNVTLEVEGVAAAVDVQAVVPGTRSTGKTAMPLRELPVTIDTVSGQTIAEQGANDLVTALGNVPGVNAFTTYGVYEYYAFRGFLDSVQLVDGVRNEGNRINTQLTNVERVEVLKGPASALYGGGALGGTVNLLRKKPSPEPAYDVMVAGGSWNTGRSAFGATGRLGSYATLYRVDVGAETKDGYRHNDATRLTVTPTLAWRVGGHQIDLSYGFDRTRFAGDAGLPLVDSDLGEPVSANIPDVPRDRNFRTPQDRATSFDHNLQAAYSRQLSARFGFRDTVSYRHFNDEYFLSEGLTFEPPTTVLRDYLYFKHHRRPLTNIAELTARFSKGVEQSLLVGWESQRYHNFTTLPEEDFFSATPIDIVNPVETQGPSDLTTATINLFTNVTHAFYAQDHVSLGSRVKLLVGGRYDIYRRNSRSDAVSDGLRTSGPVARREANAFTSRVGLVYQPASTLDVYGSFATAFKPPTQAQPDGSSLDPETGSQVEVGQRLRVAGGRAELSASVYQILKQNVAFRRPGNVYVQAGEVRSRGFEADLSTTMSRNWRVKAGYGFTDAAFLDYEESPGVNRRGNTPVFAPRHTFNLWAGYDWPNGLGVNAGGRYLGRTYADNANDFVVDGYGILNLAVRYARGRIEYALNLNNVTDTRYFTPHQDYLQVYPGDPINVLGTIRMRFQ